MADEFSQNLNALLHGRAEVLRTFEQKKYADLHETNSISKEFSESRAFSAKLFISLYKNLSLCHVEVSADEDMYPEYSEDIGKDIIKVFIDRGNDFLLKIIQEMPIVKPIFWKDPHSFKNFLVESKRFYHIGVDDSESVIRSLQQMAVYLLVMCLYGGQVNRSCFAYAPACWADVFYDSYYGRFSELGKWSLWKQSKEITDSHISNDLKKLNWSDTLQNGLLKCREILSSSTLPKLKEKFQSLIETATREQEGILQDRLEYLKVIYLTLVNFERRKCGSEAKSEFPFPSNYLWSPYGSEYINVLIFARALMKCLFKKCGLSANEESLLTEGETEGYVDKSLRDAVENIAKATILMLLYWKGKEELLLSFKKHCSCFKDLPNRREHLWLYIVDASKSTFIPTVVLCLNVLQMTGFVLEMAAEDLTPQLYNNADKIWVKVFMLLWGREYANRGGWTTFIRDALPTIKEYANDLEHLDKSIVRSIANDWPKIMSFFLQKNGPLNISEIRPESTESEIIHGPNEETLSSMSILEESGENEESLVMPTLEEPGENEESPSSMPTLEELGVNEESQSSGLTPKEPVASEESHSSGPTPKEPGASEESQSSGLTPKEQSSSKESRSSGLAPEEQSSNEESQSTPLTTEETESEENVEVIEANWTPSSLKEKVVDSITYALIPYKEFVRQGTAQVVLEIMSEHTLAEFGLSANKKKNLGSSSDSPKASASEASKERSDEHGRESNEENPSKISEVEKKSAELSSPQKKLAKKIPSDEVKLTRSRAAALNQDSGKSTNVETLSVQAREKVKSLKQPDSKGSKYSKKPVEGEDDSKVQTPRKRH